MAKALKATMGIDKNTTIFVVIGADTAIRYPYFIKIPSVIIDREGYSLKIRSLMQEERKNSHDSRIFDLFLCGEIPGEASSTKLRKAMEQGNEEVVNEICSTAFSNAFILLVNWSI